MQRNRRCSSESLDLEREQPVNKHLEECMKRVKSRKKGVVRGLALFPIQPRHQV
jgi:hypothetical protein